MSNNIPSPEEVFGRIFRFLAKILGVFALVAAIMIASYEGLNEMLLNAKGPLTDFMQALTPNGNTREVFTIIVVVSFGVAIYIELFYLKKFQKDLSAWDYNGIDRNLFAWCCIAIGFIEGIVFFVGMQIIAQKEWLSAIFSIVAFYALNIISSVFIVHRGIPLKKLIFMHLATMLSCYIVALIFGEYLVWIVIGCVVISVFINVIEGG